METSKTFVNRKYESFNQIKLKCNTLNYPDTQLASYRNIVPSPITHHNYAASTTGKV